MEYLEGETLAARCTKAAALDEALRIAIEVPTPDIASHA